jgi:hypothetical protein
MNLPSLPSFRVESFPGAPEWLVRLLGMLNQAFRPLQQAIQRLPERTEALDKTFTTNELGSAFVDLKTGFKVTHLTVTRSPTPESGENDRLWASSWRNTSNDSVRVLFVGLSPSTKYVFSAVYE